MADQKISQLPDVLAENTDIVPVVKDPSGTPTNGSVSLSDIVALVSFPVDSVNGQTGAVTINADDIPDAATVNKFITQVELDKLAGIEANATADQTGAEIKAAYEAEADTNAFTDAEQSKLAGIEAGATADQSDAEIKTAYENNADTNAFTDAEQSKLAGIEAGAQVNPINVSDFSNDAGYITDTLLADLDANGNKIIGAADPTNPQDLVTLSYFNANTGGGAVDSVNGQTGVVVIGPDDLDDALTTNKFTTQTDIDKLAGIEANATADQTGSEIKSLYEAEADTNAFTDAEQSKLAGIEAGATADQSDAEIKTAYENNADTNAFTDAEQTKLAGIEDGAQVNNIPRIQLPDGIDTDVSTYEQQEFFDTALTMGEFGDIWTNNDGDVIYGCNVTGGTGQRNICKIDLTTAGDISSASVSQEVTASEATSTWQGITLNNDQTKVYLLDDASIVYEYDLNVAGDLSTLSYTGNSYDIATNNPTIPALAAIDISQDGTKIYTMGGSGNFYEFNLSTPNDISTASFVDDFTANLSSARGLSLAKDGKALIAIRSNSPDVFEYVFSTALDITTLSFDHARTQGLLSSPAGVAVTATGKFFAARQSSEGIQEYTATALDAGEGGFDFDNSTLSNVADPIEGTDAVNLDYYNSNLPSEIPFIAGGFVGLDIVNGVESANVITGMPNNLTSIKLSDDGTKLFGGESDNNGLQFSQWSLPTANTIAGMSATPDHQFNPPQIPSSSSVQAFDFNDDGTKLYLTNSKDIWQYTLSSPFDISTTPTYDNKTFDMFIDLKIGSYTDIQWNSDGTKLYAINNNNQEIHEFDAGTAFEIDTLTYTNNSFLTGISAPSDGSMFLLEDDKTFLLVDGSTTVGQDKIVEVVMSSANDITTAALTANESPTLSGDIESITVNSDNSKIIYFDDSGNALREIDVTELTSTDFYDIENSLLSNVADPEADQDAATKVFVDKRTGSELELTDAANISWDASTYAAAVTLAGNRTLDNPTNPVAGAKYTLKVTQDATGSRTLSFDTAFKFAGGIPPTLSTGANAIDIFEFYSDGTNLHLLNSALNLS